MALTELPARLSWQVARVVDVVGETPRAKSIVLDLPQWPGHRAGQHVDVRLTADDGYQTQRSYSIASGPEDDRLALTVERLEDGEVSPYLTDVLEPGDELELRGPVGGYFVWEASMPGPLQLIAGGSGIVPLRAMLRHWAAAGRPVAVRVLHSARAWDDAIFREELLDLAAGDGLDVRYALTRAWPADWSGHRGRIDRALVEEATWPAQERPRSYVCGPTSFVETAAELLVASGHEPASVKTERFGPTGG